MSKHVNKRTYKKSYPRHNGKSLYEWYKKPETTYEQLQFPDMP